MKAAVRRARRAPVRAARRTAKPCSSASVSYLRPVEECPTYTEYFKDGDAIPSRLCPIHEGSVKQQLKRAVQGFLAGLGRKLKGIFK